MGVSLNYVPNSTRVISAYDGCFVTSRPYLNGGVLASYPSLIMGMFLTMPHYNDGMFVKIAMVFSAESLLI